MHNADEVVTLYTDDGAMAVALKKKIMMTMDHLIKDDYEYVEW